MENLVIKFYQEDIVLFVLVMDQSFSGSEVENNLEEYIEKALKIHYEAYNKSILGNEDFEPWIRRHFICDQIEAELWEDGEMVQDNVLQLSGRFLETLKVFSIDENWNLHEIDKCNTRQTKENVNVMEEKRLKIEVYDKDTDLMIVDYFIWSNLDELKSQVSDFSRKVYSIMEKGRWICDTSILTDEEEDTIYYE